MQRAKRSLLGKWSLAIGTFVVYAIITSIPDHITGIGFIAALLITGPFALGAAIFSLAIARNQKARFSQIFEGFTYFKTTFTAHLLMIFRIILWTLLLVVPGIMVALSYSMTFYILADNFTLSPKEALKLSQNMMFGHRIKLLYLGFRFLGLALLCILTLGIGFLWLIPYVQVTMAEFYQDVKGIYAEEESIRLNTGKVLPNK